MKKKTENVSENAGRPRMPLTMANYRLMLVGLGIIVLGFVLMAGKGSTPTEFNPDIFSARRVVVGPTISFLGFLFMGFAIMWSGKSRSTKNTEE